MQISFEWLEFPFEWLESLRMVRMVRLVDFNCNMLCPDSKAVRLAMVMSEYGLVQMMKGPTRVTESSETQDRPSVRYQH